jgi:hypothetical protein
MKQVSTPESTKVCISARAPITPRLPLYVCGFPGLTVTVRRYHAIRIELR